jgi:TatD DNase family protein
MKKARGHSACPCFNSASCGPIVNNVVRKYCFLVNQHRSTSHEYIDSCPKSSKESNKMNLKRMKKRPDPPFLAPGCYLIDSHCHLDMDRYNDLDDVISSAVHAGVRRTITIGIDLESSRKAVALAQRHPEIYAAVGIHPHSAEEVSESACRELEKLAKNDRVVAYGEIGLDYAKQYAPVNIQQQAFILQLSLAKKLGLPVVIHDRDAHEDTMDALRKEAPFPAGGVMHCFSGDMELAEQVLELGFYISIPGIVTFNKADTLQKVAASVPMDRLLLETDGPFLAPVPWRGKTNMPAYLPYTADKIAKLRNISINEVARATALNTEKLFGIAPLERSHDRRKS